ncbi:hypothetical protein [Neorhizobium galegae]|uniref:hypothetical protein n=1 Tax=Neorhizobium galegae TaxID=399 RepID=UPI000620EDD7|nr:hypothetical protein [Neorhizobium galegae]CDZ55072.1 Hypothetical protein NGAL_HAMBI2427_59800 [Neorhizobium galegae bv. orientalis]
MDVKKSTRRDTRTTITLLEDEYKSILRKAVDAPAHADVDIENTYGGDISITWTETSYDEPKGGA